MKSVVIHLLLVKMYYFNSIFLFHTIILSSQNALLGNSKIVIKQ